MIFKKIAVIPNQKKDVGLVHTKHIIEYFSKKKTVVYIDEQLWEFIGKSEFVKYINYDDIFNICDLILVLGGDGTIIRVSANAAAKNIPMIGINLGTIGFMSEIEADETSLLDNLYTGSFKIEHRMMIDICIEKDNGDIVALGSVLNDAVIKGHMSKLIDATLIYGNNKTKKYRGDGIIVATPTGSTAYSMSAGGPIIEPTVECFCVTPICPHTLTNSPLIFSHDSVLRIHNTNTRTRETEVYLTLDGHTSIELDENDTIKMIKSRFFTKLLTIKDIAFFHTVRNKIIE